MSIKVIVNGAYGKMGAFASDTLNNHNEFDLVAKLSKGDDLGLTIKKTKAQVVVDLTNADCVYDNALTIINHGARPVIGTTGLLPLQIKELTHLCETNQLGCIIAPNFSIAAILMMNFAAKAAEYFSEVEIIETHHQQKLDAPSGTALKTAELIASARKNKKNQMALKELIPGARGGLHCDVNIHSLRLPGILARQEVLFGGPGESLSITQDSTDRQCFMPGIVLSCKKVLELNQLIYGLENLL